ncbi:MAG: hypothetical protein WAN74_07855 [Thermoplasmata archaeon]
MESGRSKGQRLFLFGFAALMAAMVAVPVAASAGAWVSSGYNATVLQGQSIVTSIESPNGSAIAFSHAAGGYTWTMPTGITSAYLVTNITTNDLQGSSVNQITWASLYASAGNVTFGLGTSATSFLPYAYSYGAHLTSIAVGISPSYLTGDPSQHAIIEVQSSATTYGNATITARGNSGLSNWFGPAAAEDMGYIIGGIVVWVLAILAMPWYDLEVHKVTKRVTEPVKRRLFGKGREARRAAGKGGDR